MNDEEKGNCLQCNKEFIKIKRVKNHKFCCNDCKDKYYQEHPKQEDVVCSNCNKVYSRRKQGKRNVNNYCCLDCEKEFKHKQKWEERECEICKETFDCLKTKTKRFCSIQCQGKWQTTQIGIVNPRFSSHLTNCDWCYKEYYEKNYKFTNQENHFCSTECRQEWYAKVWSQTDEWKETSRKRAVKNLEEGLFSKTESGAQRIVNGILDKLSIVYVNEKGFNYCAVDNYLTEHNLIIEVMGTYWHTDNRSYSNINYPMQVNRIRMDKIKHNSIRKDYGIEILYLWEYDISHSEGLCIKLIQQYIENKGKLFNYHSLNYIFDGNALSQKTNLILPYMEWDIENLNTIIDVSVKEKMSKKQQDRWITFNCEQCDGEREELISHFLKMEHHYCGVECFHLAQKKRYQVECDNCGETVEVLKGKYDTNKHFFCDQECQHEYQKRVGFKRNGGYVEFVCEQCEKLSKKKTGDYNKSKHHFCSKECNYIYRTK